MKNRIKGEILVYVSLILIIALVTVQGNAFLTYFLPTEGWLILIIAGVGIGYIMSNSDS